MLTPQQRQRILEFCQEHQIMRIWTMDEPLLNAAVGAGRPSVIVTFRPHWAAVPQQFARMERDLAAIIGPETVLYSTDGFSPRLTDQIIQQATPVFPDLATAPVNRKAVARFCRQHHITKMWVLDGAVPNAECDRLKPSVIAETHPEHRMRMKAFSLQRELQELVCLGATLYAYGSMVEPGITPQELNEIAEVWYAEPA